MSGGGFPAPSFFGRFALFMNPVIGLNPESNWATIVALVAFLAILSWLYIVERRENKEWQFFNVVVGVVPILSMCVPLLLFNANYLSFTLPFLYLLLASLLARCMQWGKIATSASILVVLLFISFSINEYIKQINLGRGDYLGALTYMAENTDSSVIRITSDQDFRNGKLVDFYKSLIPVRQGQTIQYVDVADTSQMVDWIIIHKAEPDSYSKPIRQKIEFNNEKYWFDRSFRNSTIRTRHPYNKKLSIIIPVYKEIILK
jgi:hypothetical protein